MSLLVHELLIGTRGGGSNAASLQASPSNPVPIASVTVTHSNSAVQVAHIQQSRVVTITSSQSRLSPSEKGSRLADALAGNPPYSYANSPQRFSRSHPPNRNLVSHIVSGPGISTIQSDNLKPIRAHTTRQTYILPFVLQDHNYGAPPPPTPPHSPPPPPPPPVVSSTLPYGYKVHQIFSPTTTTTTTNARIHSNHLGSPTKVQNQYAKIVSEQQVLTINNAGTVHISNSNGSVVDAPTPTSTHTVASQIMAAMPLHRQQFMPQPKPLMYSASHIPVTTCETLTTQTVTVPPCNGGQDTDEESRLSDRSSSVGPSGEETETAPEGEGEEQIQADDSITRCICNFTHDDGYMIQCDRCFVWQHVDCMEIDRSNIPDEYLCEACKPRVTDKSKARALQIRRRQEIRAHLARVSSSDSEDNIAPTSRSKISSSGKSQDRKVLKKKKPKTSKENKNSRKHNSSSNNKSSILSASSNNVKSDHSADDKESKPSLIKSRRVSKRQSTLSGSSHSGGDEGSNNSIFSLDQLRSWIEDYEVAVTNHYSPELRAKVHAARINGISAEFRESTQGAMLGHRCRVAPRYDAGPDSFEDKILVAATRLQVGTAIIEYQGKYTLKAQWNTIQIPPGLPYLPFALQYNMLKEGLQVCVDARTYGNDARFARRSALHNAEIRHVVERGSVHLYIVASKEIDEEEEIMLPLETAICQQSVPNKSNNAQTNFIKVDGNENTKEAVKLTSTPSQIRKNGVLQNNKKNVRKPLLSLSLPQPMSRISRRTTSSESFSCDDTISSSPQTASPVKQRRASGCGGSRSPAKCILKSPSKSPCKPSLDDSSSGESPHHESPGSGDKNDSHKMTREERKIAAYMKAFERMEKAAQRRQEMEKKKVDDRGKRHHHHHHHHNNDEDDDDDGNGIHDDGEKYLHDKDGKKRRSNKGSPNKMLNTELSEEENYTSSSEGERSKPNEGVLRTYGSPPSSGINSMGFRFPKTKKALMNEWLNETVDPVLHSPSIGGEVATGVPTCYMRSPSMPPRRGGTTVSSSGLTTCDSEMAGRSAKKRWLRQAIIDETEPQNVGLASCSSPNSRPDSPNGGIGDYITPLKKRRLARESMSSEQSNTPPSTPLHSGLDDKYNEEMELDHASDENLEAVEEDKLNIKIEEKPSPHDEIKKEDEHKSIVDEDTKSNDSDHLTINISKISSDTKSEIKTEFPSQEGEIKTSVCDSVSDESESKLPNLKVESIKTEEITGDIDEDHHCTSDTGKVCEEKLTEFVKVEMHTENIKPESKKKISKSPKFRKKSLKVKYKNYDKNRNMQRKKRVVKISSKIKKKKNRLKSVNEKTKSKNVKEKRTVKTSNLKTMNKDNNDKKIVEKISEREEKKVEKKCEREEKNVKEEKSERNDTLIETSSVSQKEIFPEEITLLKVPEEMLDQKVVDNTIEMQEDSFVSEKSDTPNDCEIPRGAKDLKITDENQDLVSVEEGESQNISTDTSSSTKISEEIGFIIDSVQGPKTPEEPPVKTDSNSNYFDSSDSKTISFADEDKNFALEESKDIELMNKEILKDSESEHLPSTSLPDKQHLERDETLIKTEESLYAPPSVTSVKPAPVKRKLSILEYRKRKSISGERDPKEELWSKGMSSHSFSLEAFQETEIPFSSAYMIDNTKNSLQLGETKVTVEKSLNSPSASPTILSPVKLDKAKCESGDSEDVKWNAAPTLLEQQRENLTARLRREFGLCLPEDSQFKLKLGDSANKEKWAELEKKYQFSGKKFLPSLNSPSNSSLNVAKGAGAALNATSSSPLKGQPVKGDLQSCHAAPSVPLPPTFEKLNDVRLPPECDVKKQSVSLSERTKNEFQPFVQCKNSTTS